MMHPDNSTYYVVDQVLYHKSLGQIFAHTISGKPIRVNINANTLGIHVNDCLVFWSTIDVPIFCYSHLVYMTFTWFHWPEEIEIIT